MCEFLQGCDELLLSSQEHHTLPQLQMQTIIICMMLFNKPTRQITKNPAKAGFSQEAKINYLILASLYITC